MCYRFFWLLALVLFKILFGFRSYGGKNIYKVKGAVLAVNHASYIDPFAAGTGFYRKIFYLARKSLFSGKFSGALLRAINAVPFNREAADIKALHNIINLLKSGNVVVVFPEGTRTTTGALQPGHAGVGLMVVKAKVPVIPAYVKGSYKILPRKSRFIRLSRLSVRYGEPLYFNELYNKERPERSDYDYVVRRIMDKIAELKR